jgi:hypothetical protein
VAIFAVLSVCTPSAFHKLTANALKVDARRSRGLGDTRWVIELAGGSEAAQPCLHKEGAVGLTRANRVGILVSSRSRSRSRSRCRSGRPRRGVRPRATHDIESPLHAVAVVVRDGLDGSGVVQDLSSTLARGAMEQLASY